MRPVLVPLLFALTGPLWANAAPPDNFEVRSPNGEWVVRCHRREPTRSVHKLGASEASWTFDVTDPWNQDCFMGNDGAAVAVVDPLWIKAGELDRPAVRIVTRTGVLAEFRHEALCPRMEKSTSGGWLWRAEQSNNVLIIKAQDGTLSRISLETGRLLAQEKFDIEEERARSQGARTTAASLAAAGALGLSALLAAVIVLRRRRAVSRG